MIMPEPTSAKRQCGVEQTAIKKERGKKRRKERGK